MNLGRTGDRSTSCYLTANRFLILFLFHPLLPRQHRPLSSVPAARAAGGYAVLLSPDCTCRPYLGLWRCRPSGTRTGNQHSLKHGAIPKSTPPCDSLAEASRTQCSYHHTGAAQCGDKVRTDSGHLGEMRQTCSPLTSAPLRDTLSCSGCRGCTPWRFAACGSRCSPPRSSDRLPGICRNGCICFRRNGCATRRSNSSA